LNLVEMSVGLGLLAVLGTLTYQFQHMGWRRVQATDEKITAMRTVHEQVEALRRTLTTARWAWVVPGRDDLLYAGRTQRVIEHHASDEEHRLIVDGRPGRGTPMEAHFTAPAPHVVAFRLTAERSTIDSAVHLAAEDEDDTYARFTFEPDHPWCTHGRALHYGFVDP
jgi:hypothetical protein